MKKRRDLEYLECCKVIRWRDANKVRYPVLGLLVHIPNEGKRSIASAIKAVKQGLTKGAPDFALLSQIQSFNVKWIGGVLMIEMKTEDGKQKEEQRLFERLAVSQGNTYKICRSAFECVELVKTSLDLFND